MAFKQSLVVATLLAVALTFCAKHADAGSRSSSRSVSSSNKFSSTSTSSYKSVFSAPKPAYVAPPAPKPVYVPPPAPKPAVVAAPVVVTNSAPKQNYATTKPVVVYKPVVTSAPATKVVYATARPTYKPDHSAEIVGETIEAAGTIAGAAIIANALSDRTNENYRPDNTPLPKPKPNFSFITDCGEWVCK